MKKVIIGALSLLVMVACSQSELVETNRSDQVIEFSAITKSLTRAEDVYSNTNLPDKFTVWASFNGKTFIDGDVIEYQNGKWINTTTTRYWPADCSDTKKVTFCAYVNGDDAFQVMSGTMASFDFKVNEDVTKQEDMLYATAYASRGPVQLEFKHALYQIAYNAKCTNDKMRVVIDGVTICNVVDQNSFIVSNTRGAEGITWIYPNEGDADFSVNFEPVILDPSNVGEPQTLTIPNSSNALLLVPFNNDDLGSWDPTTESLNETTHPYFLVKCAIANVADGDEIMLWGAKNADGSYETKEIAIPIPGDHLPRYASGVQFIYTFVFGQGVGGYNPDDDQPVLTAVDWGVEVQDFTPATDYFPTIPETDYEINE